ncbi:MAG: RNA polymerase factor sigma-54 [Lentisphaerota bacterium]
MSIELGVYQNPALGQQLNLAPQLLQWLRLLQVSTTELSTMVRHELETNPALELDHAKADDNDASSDVEVTGEEVAVSEPAQDQDLTARLEMLSELDSEWRNDFAQSRSQSGRSIQDEQEKHQFLLDCLVADSSLQEHLTRQLTSAAMTESERMLAVLVIGSLDERGYLSTSMADLAALTGVTAEEADAVLSLIQEMDPPGIGARDLRECLLLQLQMNRRTDSLAYRMVKDHADLLERGQMDELAERLAVASDELEEARQDLAALNPEPGRAFCSTAVQYVQPDVTISRNEGQYQVELNDDCIPHLRLSASCRQLLEEKKLSSEDLAYIRRKIRTATFLIQGIGQRQETLHKVALEILRVQKDYFDLPDGELKPLTMVEVASVLGVHETTISRAIANKYLETPRGLYEMKYFFRAGYQCNDGSTLTPESVKDIISGLIDQEDKAHPLTDLQIVQLLQKKGLKLARRTVAKYRDEMFIATSKDRTGRRSARLVVKNTVAGSEAETEPVEACAVAL